MEKWIKAGRLPAMKVTVNTDKTEITSMQELMEEISNFLLRGFQEMIDPEISQEENLDDLTQAAKAMLSLMSTPESTA